MVVDTYWVKKGHFDWLRAVIGSKRDILIGWGHFDWLRAGFVRKKKGKCGPATLLHPKLEQYADSSVKETRWEDVFLLFCFVALLVHLVPTEDLSTFFFADLGEGKFESVYAHWLGSLSPETWVRSLLYFMKRDFQTIKIVLMNFTPETYYFPSSARPTPPCVLNPCPNLKDKQINHGEW